MHITLEYIAGLLFLQIKHSTGLWCVWKAELSKFEIMQIQFIISRIGWHFHVEHKIPHILIYYMISFGCLSLMLDGFEIRPALMGGFSP